VKTLTRSKSKRRAKLAQMPLPGMLSTSVPAGIVEHDALAIGTTTADPPHVRHSRLLALSRDREGWWLNAAAISPDVPRWGPYRLKSEANEARLSWLRNGLGVGGGATRAKGGR
jgi:hypothetical protein